MADAVFPAADRTPARIALLVDSLALGGVGRNTLRLARSLLDRGLAVDLVTRRGHGALRDLVPPGVRVVALETARSPWPIRLLMLRADPAGLRCLYPTVLRPHRPLRCYDQLPALVRYLRENRPDALVSALVEVNLLAVAAARAVGTRPRVLVSERSTVTALTRVSGSTEPEHRAMPELVRRSYLRADAVVAVSDGVADHLARQAGLPRERITTVYNPIVGPELFAAAGEPVDHPWFAPGQPPVVLAAGRLYPQKDFPTLVRAFARLRARVTARLVILGEAPQARPGATEAARAELGALADSLGVAGDVDLPGFVANPFAYMTRAGLFALSSAWEGLPTVLVEALACGCPVVSTDCPSGPAEILGGGRWGRLAPVGDDAALAEAMELTLAEAPDRAALRARAADFSVERATDTYLRLLFPGRRR